MPLSKDQAMNSRSYIAALAITILAGPVVAQEPPRSLPTVEVEAIVYVADCADRSLPSQGQVGEWTGQDNFSQVYATRQQLMAGIGRACRKEGIGQVHVVSMATAAARELHPIAVNRAAR